MSDIIAKYIQKQKIWVNYPAISNFNPDLIIVIPCHNEPNITPSIQSILDNHFLNARVEIVVVINHAADHNDQVKSQSNISLTQLNEYSNMNDSFKITTILALDLPPKKAGVGLARKIGMDYACMVFNQSGKDGIIACYDADSKCAQNYIKAVINIFEDNPKLDGITIAYEHPKSGNEYSNEIYKAIAQYEKHLYYYIDIQKSINLPFAYHTVGSSMAVRATSYAKLGGMNTRKAGEDFYFMQKLVENGMVKELNSTKVYPSPRISDRVPFGTGKAIKDLMENNNKIIYFTYHPQSFYALQPFIENLQSIYSENLQWKQIPLHVGLVEFLNKINIESIIEDCAQNSSSFVSFRKRFFRHFNAFQLMKYLHFMRDHYFANIPVDEAIQINKS